MFELNMKNTLLREIKKSLETIKKTGEINRYYEEILFRDISRLDNRLVVMDDEWMVIKNSDGFFYWQAIHTIHMIIVEINKFFKYIHTSDENIKFVKNLLSLLPTIDHILSIVQKYKIEEKSIDEVLNKTGLLIKLAVKANLRDPEERREHQ